MDDQPTAAPLRRIPATEARALLEEHEQSDLTLAAFARDRGVQPWTLYNARAQARRKQRRESKATFTPVAVLEEAPKGKQPIEMTLPSGLTLRLERDFDEVTLRRLLGMLAGC